MNILLLILALITPVDFETKMTDFVMRETVTVMRSLTRVGCEFESEALCARLTLKMLLRRDSAIGIDFERYYIAEQRVTDLQQIRQDITFRYNLFVKIMEKRGGTVPSGLPCRIRLEPTEWGLCFQYI